VIITDRGRPSHVLLSIEDYRALTGGGAKIAALLALPGGEDIAFDPPKAVIAPRAADLGV
jgi:hypothetical protein